MKRRAQASIDNKVLDQAKSIAANWEIGRHTERDRSPTKPVLEGV